jgi:hypothetical protein
MHAHNEFGWESAPRPRGDRVESDREPAAPWHGAAAAQGRTDVLGPAGLLGLQRAVGNAGVGALLEEDRSPVHNVVNSGGSALDEPVRKDMESRFGQDFGSVRVHTGAAAHDSATSVQAQAYTVGDNIVFQSGRYDPSSGQGQHMLAHELTHVVQQRSGPVDGTEAGGGVKVSDPSDRFEREAVSNADRVMSAPPTAQRCAEDHDHSSHNGGETPAAQTYVQRAEAGKDEAPEEEETAQTYVQRAEEGVPEEDEATE